MAAVKHYLWQIVIAIDQLVNTLIGGWADETMSSYAWRLEREGKFWGRVWRPTADAFFRLFFGQKDHCRNSYWAERERAQLPPEMRT